MFKRFPFFIHLSLLMLIAVSGWVSMLSAGQSEFTGQPIVTEYSLELCDKIDINWTSPPLQLNSIGVSINNGDAEPLELQSVEILWPDLASPWNNMYMGVMALDNDPHWTGGPDANNKSGNRTFVNTGQLMTGYRFIGAEAGAVWSGIFFNGPSDLSAYMTGNDFTVIFTFSSANGDICEKGIVGIAFPTPTSNPPTTTAVPNCYSNVTLVWSSFVNSGGVVFKFSNNSTDLLYVTGFDLVWPDATHPDITGEPAGGYGLSRVYAGGDTLGEGTLIWQADPPVKPGNTNVAPPYNNRTDSAQKGSWITNGALPAGTTTRIYLDFDDITGSLYNFGARSHHFDQTRFRLSACGGSHETETPIPTHTPTATSTVVDLPTDVPPTATDPAITITPRETATQPPALQEILPNTSFETDSNNDKTPDGWKAKDNDLSSKNKLKCKAGSDHAHSGNCAYKFKGNPDGSASKLTFKTNEIELPELFQYEFSAHVKSKHLTSDMLVGKAKIVFTDGTAETLRLYPQGPYTVYQSLFTSGFINRTGRTLKKLKVQFMYPAANGKMWLDDVSLKILLASSPSLHPLP